MESNYCPSAYQPIEAKPAHISVCYFRMHCAQQNRLDIYVNIYERL